MLHGHRDASSVVCLLTSLKRAFFVEGERIGKPLGSTGGDCTDRRDWYRGPSGFVKYNRRRCKGETERVCEREGGGAGDHPYLDLPERRPTTLPANEKACYQHQGSTFEHRLPDKIC